MYGAKNILSPIDLKDGSTRCPQAHRAEDTQTKQGIDCA